MKKFKQEEEKNMLKSEYWATTNDNINKAIQSDNFSSSQIGSNSIYSSFINYYSTHSTQLLLQLNLLLLHQLLLKQRSLLFKQLLLHFKQLLLHLKQLIHLS